DLERGRQFAVSLGHRRAPSLGSAACRTIFSPRKNGVLCKLALSVITTILPSEKAKEAAGTCLKSRKRVLKSRISPPRLIWTPFRYKNGSRFCWPQPPHFHPIFTVHRA